MKFWSYIISIVVGIGIGYFIFSKTPQNRIITNTVIDTVYNNSTDTITITKWKVKEKTLPNDTIYIGFDSIRLLNIARAYYTINQYDTTITGSECQIGFRALIYKNEFLHTNFIIKNNRPTQINNTTVYKSKYYIGGGLSTQGEVWGGFGFIHKRMMYLGEFGIVNKQVKVSAYYSM